MGPEGLGLGGKCCEWTIVPGPGPELEVGCEVEGGTGGAGWTGTFGGLDIMMPWDWVRDM